MKYWDRQRWDIIKAKEKPPQKCRFGNTCFTSLSVIGGKIYSPHPNHRNHVHKDHNDFLSLIIKFGTNVSGGDNFFNDIICVYDLCQISHVLKHLHIICIVGPFERFFMGVLYGEEINKIYLSFFQKQYSLILS